MGEQSCRTKDKRYSAKEERERRKMWQTEGGGGGGKAAGPAGEISRRP